ncbi:MAG TPA: biotin/lipoate A/B protein ligase family protein [Spirochaetia bacterium]|nr:biotin/lipoate A/B protein ligase family protein [Spirochaetia bacterium]
MAVDEALLESVEQGGSPVVRLYGFAPPTLSLGRFQKSEGLVDFRRLADDGMRYVRRPSGGQAVLHTGELTYAFLIGKSHLEPYGKRHVYRFIAPLLIAGLEGIGVTGTNASPVRRGDPHYPDCFASTGEYEIDSQEGRKLVGSAQMVTRGAVLQHGSIPITSDNRNIANYLSGLNSAEEHAGHMGGELGRIPQYDQVRAAYVAVLSEALPVDMDRLSAKERNRAEELLKCKYETDEWNRSY